MMLAHLSKFSRLISRQHGFLSYRLTQTNLRVAEEFVIRWLDEPSAVDLIYQDFFKVSDSVNHQLLSSEAPKFSTLTVISLIKLFPSWQNF